MVKNKKVRLGKEEYIGRTHILKVIARFYIILISFILVISMLSLPAFKNKIFYMDSIEQITNSEMVTNTLLAVMGTEIPSLERVSEQKVPSLSNLVLSLSTGINTRDFASYLGKELPGFEAYHTEIYVAGIGSDYSNLPMESPPPNFDELLQNEETESDSENEQPKNVTKTDNPSVFIYHSHSWEAYRPLMDEEKKPSDSSSVDPSENILLVGSLLTEQLEKYGINTLHNKTNVAKQLHERGMTWLDSYTLSREIISKAVSNHQDLKYYIDIHRDALSKDDTTMMINGKPYARLYFVVGEENKNYKQNLNFVENLNANLEKAYPGISRGIYLKDKYDGNGVYNQDMSERAILIEVGGIENTKEELKNTVEAFAEVFQKIYDGAIEVDTQS